MIEYIHEMCKEHVRQIDTYNDRIRVWLVEEEENV